MAVPLQLVEDFHQWLNAEALDKNLPIPVEVPLQLVEDFHQWLDAEEGNKPAAPPQRKEIPEKPVRRLVHAAVANYTSLDAAGQRRPSSIYGEKPVRKGHFVVPAETEVWTPVSRTSEKEMANAPAVRSPHQVEIAADTVSPDSPRSLPEEMANAPAVSPHQVEIAADTVSPDSPRSLPEEMANAPAVSPHQVEIAADTVSPDSPSGAPLSPWMQSCQKALPDEAASPVSASPPSPHCKRLLRLRVSRDGRDSCSVQEARQQCLAPGEVAGHEGEDAGKRRLVKVKGNMPPEWVDRKEASLRMTETDPVVGERNEATAESFQQVMMISPSPTSLRREVATAQPILRPSSRRARIYLKAPTPNRTGHTPQSAPSRAIFALEDAPAIDRRAESAVVPRCLSFSEGSPLPVGSARVAATSLGACAHLSTGREDTLQAQVLALQAELTSKRAKERRAATSRLLEPEHRRERGRLRELWETNRRLERENGVAKATLMEERMRRAETEQDKRDMEARLEEEIKARREITRMHSDSAAKLQEAQRALEDLERRTGIRMVEKRDQSLQLTRSIDASEAMPVAATASELKVGDYVYRKGEPCTVVEVDYETNPPSVVVQLEDGWEVNTEEQLLSHEAELEPAQMEKSTENCE